MTAPTNNSCWVCWRSALRRLLLWGIVLAFAAAVPLTPARAASEAPTLKQYELKAAYLYNFVKFTEWPAASFASPDAPIVIGILGNERIASVLEKLVTARQVHGRTVEVRALSSATGAAGVHVLYVAEAEDGLIGAISKELSSAGLLAVGESERFLSAGGTIRFIVEGDRLQFEVNSAASRRAGLTLSSQLLMLAKSVRN